MIVSSRFEFLPIVVRCTGASWRAAAQHGGVVALTFSTSTNLGGGLANRRRDKRKTSTAQDLLPDQGKVYCRAAVVLKSLS
jgi:hypothetical protein